MTANARRQEIVEILSDRRSEKIENLMSEFNVSRSTIKRDIEELSLSYPIYSVSGNGGGIRVADGWYSNRRYLKPVQEELLIKLKSGLQPDDIQVMESILAAFATPKIDRKDCKAW